jgi:hypothetical protein
MAKKEKKPNRNAEAAEAETAVVAQEAVTEEVVEKVVTLPLIKVRANAYFKDGSILPRAVQAEEVIEVTEPILRQLQMSAPRNWERVKGNA